ncbi:hypothetical protein PAXINDRAFT_158241 [Paxillus involutus ATCC 200175]|uniref:Unplaced genomic scaffold PAXINscaffold_396, whole genome shotgun sequence n=1 Tax=Paxillus involutus ATCC 200175 TaxID=664439 RepID=A0A0C9SY28_PAXIN|nr:hypothetical protein PAXINDRAFT_158241 [Paxillus involutus ATCC 200175]
MSERHTSPSTLLEVQTLRGTGHRILHQGILYTPQDMTRVFFLIWGVVGVGWAGDCGTNICMMKPPCKWHQTARQSIPQDEIAQGQGAFSGGLDCHVSLSLGRRQKKRDSILHQGILYCATRHDASTFIGASSYSASYEGERIWEAVDVGWAEDWGTNICMTLHPLADVLLHHRSHLASGNRLLVSLLFNTNAAQGQGAFSGGSDCHVGLSLGRRQNAQV